MDRLARAPQTPVPYAPAVELKVLGPLEVTADGRRLDLGGPKQRTVLAVLLAHAGQPVALGSIIDAVYGDDAGDRAHRSVHTFVSNLRGVIGETIERRGNGYAFIGDRRLIDAAHFEGLLAVARSADDPAETATVLRQALDLWRGHPYADIDAHTALRAEVTRLAEMRVAAIEARVDADLQLGRDRELVAELESLTGEHPLNERLRALHMLALYRAGRHGDALRACAKTRTHLAELGLDPSPELHDLEQRILEHDAELLAGPRSTVRRASVLVIDAGHDELTRLGPAERHQAVSAYSAAVDHVVASRGGQILGVRGSATYAVFDDVSAAAAAAIDCRRSTDQALIHPRSAVATGDIERSGDHITGPPVSRAASLVAVAHAGQILLSMDTHTSLAADGRPGFLIRSLGSHDIPGLEHDEPVYQLDGDDHDRAFPPLLIGSPTPPLPVSERGVPGFELRDEIGVGSRGSVFRAYQPSMGREVAVTVIRAELANQTGFIHRFEVEAQMAGRLQHPAIVPLLDYWRDPEGAYLVSRLMRGGSLADRLADGGVSGPEVKVIVETVAAALVYAHERGVAHGAVSPSNVLFDEDGNAALAGFAVDRPDGPTVDAVQRDVAQLARLAKGLLADSSSMAGVIETATKGPGFSSVAEFVAEWNAADGSSADLGFTEARNPYKGLRAFGEPDARDFYGRTDEVDRLVDLIGTRRLVAVVGPSGSGKSSVVRAGLVPAVRSGQVDGRDGWLVTDMIPGRYPYEELAAALLRVSTRTVPRLEDELRADERGLLKAVKQCLPSDVPLLLVIDQFEELFTMVDDEHERTAFIDLLRTTAADDRSSVRIVVTMRADFFDRPLHYGDFGDLLRDATVPIAVPDSDSLRDIITEPAVSEGVRLAHGLVDRILGDVADEPGALPLLEFSLTEMFDERQIDVLTTELYEHGGGVLGALRRRAEAVFMDLSPKEQAIARQVFIRLVNMDATGRHTRRRARQEELLPLGSDRQAVTKVLAEYGRHRLLTFDRDPITRGPTVEVAHEAILREWPRLVGWVADLQHDLLMHRKLASALEDWEESDRSDSYLLSAGRLAQHRSWTEESELQLTSGEREFLEASGQADEALQRRRRIRRGALTVGFAAAAAVATVLALSATSAQQRAEDQAALAATRAEEAAAAADLAAEQQAIAESEAARAEEEAINAVAASAFVLELARAEAASDRPDVSDAVVADELVVDVVGDDLIRSIPTTPRLDFLLEKCVNCQRDAVMVNEEGTRATGIWLAHEPFHIRHGFENHDEAPLVDRLRRPEYDLRLYLVRTAGPVLSGDAFPLDVPLLFRPDYLVRTSTDRCGPGYRNLEGPVPCDQFVHDFPDGLPPGRYEFFLEWYAPCRTWVVPDACGSPGSPITLFFSSTNMPWYSAEFTADDDPGGAGNSAWPFDPWESGFDLDS